MVGDEEEKGAHTRRISLKTLASFNNYPKWKHKLRENCFKRVRQDRTRLLWKSRTPEHEFSSNQRDRVKSTLQDIVSDELRKIKGSSSPDETLFGIVVGDDDMIWEYEGLHTAYQGDCEEMLLEMQRIFYEDLRNEESRKGPTGTWEDEEDEYLARVVCDHMRINSDDQAAEEEVFWCPVCKQGKLEENGHHIYCGWCKFKLVRGPEVDLNLLRARLGEAHAEHLDRGCRLSPNFCVETKFELTALYIKCTGCNTFEIVL